MAESLGLIGTIESDDEKKLDPESSDSENESKTVPKKNKKKKDKKHADFNEDFDFDFDEETSPKKGLKTKNKKNISKPENDEEGEEQKDKELDYSDEFEDDEQVIIDIVKDKEKKQPKTKKGKKKLKNEELEKEETMSYAEVVTSYEKSSNFQDMELSRPIMKALHSLGWEEPTPIQAAVIPKALMGLDICACAATGTGKTGAFMIPVLERLLYKPNKSPVTRVLILTPTRELAIQNYQVSRQLAEFTKIQISLSAGGIDRSAQEAALRLGPDVVIATLGRLIDHLQNAPSFNLDDVEILILDEADRMLDEYFEHQMKEVMARCSRNRQTLLFSATMTEKVEDLATVSLNKPIKVFVNENIDVAMNLRQEFVRIRPQREDDREAIVAALIKRFFDDECIVFVQTKKGAHRMRLILSLLGVKAGELHGNLTQPQRLEALQKFKDGEISVLLATDLVARGLDIAGVKTVINMTMPPSIERYIHRVGRTARAGKTGTAVTLVGEQERHMFAKIAKRAAENSIKVRLVSKDVISEFKEKIAGLKKAMKALEIKEKEDRELRIADNQIKKATAVMDNRNRETGGRPKRKWFQTHDERTKEKAYLSKLAKNEIGEGVPKAKRTKLR